MRSELRYLVFGLLVLAGYGYTASRGVVWWNDGSTPSGPSTRAGLGGRSHPSFWSTGFQGGK